jgi:uncharacterized protein YqjF (DUF2071 family)
MAGPSAEQRVTVPTLKASWLATAFVHWRVPSARIQSLLPQGLTVDEYDGWAWVGLVPFVMAGMRPPGLPDPSGAFARLAAIRGMSRVPDPSTTPETNLRTYVRGPDGRDGLWFFSLDVGNAALAVALRGLVGAPYHVGRLVVDRHDDVVTYTGSRVGGGQSYHLVVRPAAEIRPSALEAWLTGRWRAYTRHLGRLLVTPVEHEPWPLQAARLDALEQNLTDSVDLGALTDPPLAHFSAGVRHVRVGFPRLVERRTEAQGADT